MKLFVVFVFLSFLATVAAWNGRLNRSEIEEAVRHEINAKFENLERKVTWILKGQHESLVKPLTSLFHCIHPNHTETIVDLIVQFETSFIARDTFYKRQNGPCKHPIDLEPIMMCADKVHQKFQSDFTSTFKTFESLPNHFLCEVPDLNNLMNDVTMLTVRYKEIFPVEIQKRLEELLKSHGNIQKLDTDEKLSATVAHLVAKELLDSGNYSNETIEYVEILARIDVAILAKLPY